MIAQDSIEALKARVDIVDVISSYIELRKNGANFKAPCPFHDEKSPSFVVSPAKQIYHCFGCGAGGDSIKFVMEYSKLSYPEAIEKLAQEYNFTLTYTNNNHHKPQSNLMPKLSQWYQSLLLKHPQALHYLHERGIFDSTIEKFALGYAPASHESIRFIKSNLFSIHEAIEYGVVGSENGREYARFIERIIFPIQANNGTIIGFGGRTITGHQAKYINSPQTKYFNKSRLLYAYHLARESIYKTKEIIITEGYLDVIMLHQAGFNNAVATLGTALTKEHLPLLRKGEPHIIMAYDGDSAGQNAALKASMLLASSNFRASVVLFEEGLDPADMVKNGHINELKEQFRHAKNSIDFVLESLIAQHNIKDAHEKELALKACSNFLKTLSPLLQEEYKRTLAALFGISTAYIKLDNTPNIVHPASNESLKYSDPWELALIKTALEKPQLLNSMLDYIAPSFLSHHANEFSLALSNDNQDPALLAIAINESIPIFKDETELKQELLTFLRAYYNRELKKIQSQPSNFETKAFEVRKLRGKIAKLQRGELVAI